MRARNGLLALLLVSLALPAAAARAGVMIVSESETPATKPKEGQAEQKTRPAKPEYSGRLFVDGNQVRMEGTSRDADGELGGTVLYRAEPEAVLVLNDDERSYFEITRADAQRIGAAIDVARTQLEAQMENMTPEQRAMLEEALGGFAGGGKGAKGGKAKAKPQPAKAVATGGSDTIGGYACQKFDVVRGAKRIAEACVASWQDLGLSADDVAGIRKLAAFQQKVFSDVEWAGLESAPGAEVFEVMDQIKGFPVRVRTTADGKPVVMRVVKVERRDLDPSLFKVPAGYSKSMMPSG